MKKEVIVLIVQVLSTIVDDVFKIWSQSLPIDSDAMALEAFQSRNMHGFFSSFCGLPIWSLFMPTKLIPKNYPNSEKNRQISQILKSKILKKSILLIYLGEFKKA